ncbi:beta-2 adrenergic receptor-like [Asterias rubens]|uniref:beta-2 adrenergic receptor-like n=1 Tax=Asterias rubens TaxID=7604 RepID=UPI001455C539|nr:beta-2 adrenergic receptor-like [Asterias rubens]
MESFTAAFNSSTCPNDIVCILETTFVIVVAFLTLISNIMNIVVLLTTPALRNSHGYFLLSLSVADLGIGAVAALSIYPSATLQNSPDSWPYGDTVCLISTYAMQICLTNSGLTLTFMSIERYIAVAHPLKYSRLVTKRKTLLVIAIGWIITVLVFGVGVRNHIYFGFVYTCVPLLKDGFVVVYIVFFVGTLPGLIVIVITSVIVRKKLEKNAKQFANPSQSSSSQDTHSSPGTSPRTIKLFRMVRIMAVAVVVCWFPFFGLLLINISFGLYVPQVIYFLTFWMLVSNGYVNSFIYFAMNKTFHSRVEEVWKQLTPSCCRRLNELEKNLDCTSCICSKGIQVELNTSGNNTNKTRDNYVNSVELVKIKVQGVDNEGFGK